MVSEQSDAKPLQHCKLSSQLIGFCSTIHEAMATIWIRAEFNRHPTKTISKFICDS